MTRFYLAARYSRREELAAYAHDLGKRGHEVRARWLDGEHQWGGAALETARAYEDRGEIMPDAFRFAADDWEDVQAADMVIAFTETPRDSLSHEDVAAALETSSEPRGGGIFVDVEQLRKRLNHYAAKASRGGRHVEYGIALALEKAVIVVGPQENIFHLLPQVEHYPDWPAYLEALDG